MPTELFWQIVLIFILIGVNGFFALAEIALVTVRPTQIVGMVESGVAGAKHLQRLTRDSNRFLSTIQVAITLSGFLASASATATLAQPFGSALSTLGIPAAWSQWASIFMVTLVVSYFSLVWGELVPKQLALGRPRVWALRVVRPVEWFGGLLYPFVVVLSASTQLILKVFRVNPDEARSRLSEDEIRRMVIEHRTLEDEEKELIESVFQLRDILVREVMTPRGDVVALEAESCVADAIALVRETGYSRFPVYKEDIDEIVGIATAKDLFAALLDGKRDVPVGDICRETLVVPGTNKALSLLQELRGQRVHLAIVVDEYGGTAGIVTFEDLLEEIVGDIHDESDPEPRQKIVSNGNNEFVVDAGLRLEEVNEELNLALTIDDTYETLAGFLLTQFQRVPEQGETFKDKGLAFTIEEVKENRIERVRITRAEPSDKEAEKDEETRGRGNDP